MAGSGNLQVIRICHYLRNRVLVRDAHRDAMAYSTQVATHMTLGLLILGRARCFNTTVLSLIICLPLRDYSKIFFWCSSVVENSLANDKSFLYMIMSD